MNCMEVTEKQWVAFFHEINPGFFNPDHDERMQKDKPSSEMCLNLRKFDENCYEKKLPENITFGCLNKDLDELLAVVEKVMPIWVPLFDGRTKVYCGFVDGKIVSFCMVEDLGEHILAGERVKIGSPGCAGTLPEYRNRGIGMVMLRNVTKILRDAMYDYSYVHHTYETEWLKKLGYEVVLRWDDRGFIWS